MPCSGGLWTATPQAARNEGAQVILGPRTSGSPGIGATRLPG